MGTLKITPPDKSSPGFLKRMRESMKMRKLYEAGDPAVVDLMVEMMRPYVTSYEGYASIVEALEEASAEQWQSVFNMFEGK